MPTPLADVIGELDLLLEPERFEDYCVNGLQVPGPSEVEHVVTAVSAHAELFELAAQDTPRPQLILVHHGLFWGDGVRSVDPQLRRRLKLLFDADIALAAYHLPLDAHPTLGNNALIAQNLGATDLTPFAPHRGQPIGQLATFRGDGIASTDLFKAVAELTGREPLVFAAGPPRVTRLGIVSGGGVDYLASAAEAGADAFLTGEPAERAMAEARERGIHLIAAGHYATETFGVRRLGEHLSERFGVTHAFLDVPNPV